MYCNTLLRSCLAAVLAGLTLGALASPALSDAQFTAPVHTNTQLAAVAPPAAAPVATPKRLPTAASAVAAASTSSKPAQHTTDSLAPLAWGGLILLISLGLTGVVRGLSGSLVVYTDYTDAALATLGFWGGLLAWIILTVAAGALDAPLLADADLPAFVLIVVASLVVSARTAWRANASVGSAVLSTAAKLLVTLAFIAFAVLSLSRGEDRGRRADESDLAYALRMQQERQRARANRVMLAALTAATLYLVHKLTRNPRWVSLHDHLRMQRLGGPI
ncbi:MAG: hypothetical protein ACP5GC_08485 [Thiomonas sp.]